MRQADACEDLAEMLTMGAELCSGKGRRVRIRRGAHLGGGGLGRAKIHRNWFTLFATNRSKENCSSAARPHDRPSLSTRKSLVVRKAEKSDDLDRRLAILVEAETKVMFQMICRGLFEKHKGLFAFMIAASIQREKGAATAAEWAFFLKVAAEMEGLPPNPAPDWLDQKAWAFINAAEVEVPTLAGLKGHLEKSADDFRGWYESSAPQCRPKPKPRLPTATRRRRQVRGISLGAEASDQLVKIVDFSTSRRVTVAMIMVAITARIIDTNPEFEGKANNEPSQNQVWASMLTLVGRERTIPGLGFRNV